MNIRHAVTIVTIVTFLSACSSGGGFVSVEEKLGGGGGARYDASRSGWQATPPRGNYIVAAGDTLYSIAWRYGLDHYELAAANHISSPYTIYPGQEIRLRYSASAGSAAVASSAGNPAPAVSKDNGRITTTVEKSQSTPSRGGILFDNSWVWPATGGLTARFSTKEPVNKGIDIAGALGDSVLAAAAGTVVYAGQGVRGYGNLVIVQHDENFLSAYAHSSRILVSEKDVVKAGQKIAEIGSTGTDSVKLHFEVRKNGKPVDPLQFLPSR